MWTHRTGLVQTYNSFVPPGPTIHQGWETAVLPLLREQEGSGSSRTTTAEERVIGAGLKAINRNKDGAAIKEMFHVFAVTQEDFVHPIAVIEILWRACCASHGRRSARCH